MLAFPSSLHILTSICGRIENLGNQMDRQGRELTMNDNVKTIFVTKLAMVSKGHDNQESSNYL